MIRFCDLLGTAYASVSKIPSVNKLSCSNPHSDYSLESNELYKFSNEELLPAQKLPSPGLSSLEKIKNLETELKSVNDRLNQIENRFTNLEGRLYELNYPNDPNYDYKRPLY